MSIVISEVLQVMQAAIKWCKDDTEALLRLFLYLITYFLRGNMNILC